MKLTNSSKAKRANDEAPPRSMCSDEPSTYDMKVRTKKSPPRIITSGVRPKLCSVISPSAKYSDDAAAM